jgi:hypothetical protein
MTTPVEGTKTIEVRGIGAAFKSFDNCAQIHSGRVAEKEMDVVGFAAKLNHCAPNLPRHRGKQVSKKGKVSENLAAELRAEDNGTQDGRWLAATSCSSPPSNGTN